jgi:16S rRNA (guanine966-N2)-methyltransferase
MNRIVGGTLGGRRLHVPASGTRPTSERAREGLFNTLESTIELPGSRFLDLFAGSGAVGLEALSRGADAAVFVESDRRAAATVADNARRLGVSGASVHGCTVESYLAGAGADPPFDVAFADPPYSLPAAALERLLAGVAAERWLRPGSLVVLERASRSGPPPWPAGIEAVKQRRYGEGTLWYGRRL